MPASAILGEPPKAPKPPDVPDIEDVLGPPPRPPSLGKRGKSHALGLISPYRRRWPAPHAPRLGHSSRELQPRGGQKIVLQDKRKPRLVKSEPAPKTPQQEYAPQEPEVSQFAGNPIQRGVRRAAQTADIIEPDRKERQTGKPPPPPPPRFTSPEAGEGTAAAEAVKRAEAEGRTQPPATGPMTDEEIYAATLEQQRAAKAAAADKLRKLSGERPRERGQA